MKITRLLTLAFLAVLSQITLASTILVVDENDDPIPFKQITVADSIPYSTTSAPISYTTDANGEVQHTPGTAPSFCYLLIRVQDCAGIWQKFITDSNYPSAAKWFSSKSPIRVCRQAKPGTVALNFYWRKSVFSWWPKPTIPTNFWLKHYKLSGSTPQLVGSYSFMNKSSLDTSLPHQDYGRFVLKAVDCTGDTISTVWDYDYNQTRVYQSRVWICDSLPTDSLFIGLSGPIIGAHNYFPVVLKDSSFSNNIVQYDTLNTTFHSNNGRNFIGVFGAINQPGNAKLTFLTQTCGGYLPVYEFITNSSIPRITDSIFTYCGATNFAVSEFILKPRAIVLPNPFNESILINLAEEQRNSRVDLIGMQGNVLQSSELTNKLEIKLETDNLPVGMYLIQITSAAGTETHKVIKP